MTQKLNPKRGVTLLELLVVCLIISILSLVAVSSYSTYQRTTRIKSGSQSINSAFVTARSFAVTTNAWYRVVIQLDNYSFWVDEIEPYSSNDPCPVLPEAARKPKITTPESLPDGLRVTDIVITSVVDGTTTTCLPAANSFAVIRFRPDGTSDAASVHLIDEHSDAAAVENYYTVKLYSPTAKPAIIPREKS